MIPALDPSVPLQRSAELCLLWGFVALISRPISRSGNLAESVAFLRCHRAVRERYGWFSYTQSVVGCADRDSFLYGIWDTSAGRELSKVKPGGVSQLKPLKFADWDLWRKSLTWDESTVEFMPRKC